MFEKYIKQIIMAFLIVAVCFCLSFYVTLYLRKHFNNTNTKNLIVNYDVSDSIKISNSLPISNALGKKIDESNEKQGYDEITIKNPNNSDVKYQIYLKRIKQDAESIDENYIKLYLTDDADNPLSGFEKNLIPTYYSLTYLNDKPDSKLLYRGVIKGNTSEKLKLRVWVADTYVITSNKKDFSFKIYVKKGD